MTPAAGDDALDVFDLLTGDLMRQARRGADAARLRSLRDLDAAAWQLRDAWLTLKTTAADHDSDLRTALHELDTAGLDAAAATVQELARDPEEVFHDTLLARYTTLRRVLPRLLATLDFDASGLGAEGGAQEIQRGQHRLAR